MKCPKCGNTMTEGFVADKSMDIELAQQQVWGTGTKFGGMFGAMKDARKVKTFRCPGCGYLESYAK